MNHHTVPSDHYYSGLVIPASLGSLITTLLITLFPVDVSAQLQPPNEECETVLVFDGQDDFMEVPHHVSLNVTNAITVAAWVKTSSNTGEEYIMTKGDDSFYFALGGGTIGSEVSIYLNGVSSDWLRGTTQVGDNTWHHVAATWDGSTIHLYVDGNLEATENKTGTISTGSNELRAGYRLGQSTYSGAMDELQLWNIALSEVEIGNIMNFQMMGDEAGLVGYWNFNEAAGLTANDKTANGNHGILNGVEPGDDWQTPDGTPNPCSGGALDFDGVNDRVFIDDTERQITDEFTIEFRIKLNNTSQVNRYILGKTGLEDFGSFWAIRYGFTANQLDFSVEPGGSTGDDPGPGSQLSITDTEWHHVAYAYNGTLWEGYVDGVKVFSLARNFSLTYFQDQDYFGTYILGASDQLGIHHANIQLDEVRIWDRALCSPEIQNNMNCHLSGPQVGLSAYYDFNSGIDSGNNGGTTFLSDKSGNGKTANLENFALNGTSSNFVASPLTTSCAPFNLAVDLGADISNCGQATLNAGNAGATYLWSDLSTSQTLTVTSSGTYSVEITTSDGCTRSDEITVTILPAPTLAIGANVEICAGQPANLQVTATANGTHPTSTEAFTNATNFPIPDTHPANGAGILSPIMVGSSPFSAAQVAAVKIESVSHTYISDLIIDLIAPDGSSIRLVNRVGSNGDNMVDLVLSGTGPTISTLGGTVVSPVTGSFMPEQPFRLLTGPATGTWYLKVVDVTTGDAGTLHEWSLVLPTPNTIESYSWSPAEGLSSTTIANPEARPTTTTTYSVTVTDARGCTSVATQTVAITNTIINTQPESEVACAGEDVSFAVSASGSSLTYQWRKGATNLTDGGNISGASTATLSLNNISADDGGDYNCVITGDCGALISGSSALTVLKPASITSQPLSKTECQGGNVTISILASGSGLTYQWRKGTTNLTDGGNISGATTAALSITNISADDAGNYNCVVSGACSITNSSENSALTVGSLPTITSPPTNAERVSGQSVTFTVGATGATNFQWQKGDVNVSDGDKISGATTSSLTITGLMLEDAGQYKCIVSNSCLTIPSSSAALVVNRIMPVITFTSASTRGVEGEQLIISATSTSTAPILFTTIGGTGQASFVSPGNLKLEKAGTIEITATQTETGEYGGASASQIITIDPDLITGAEKLQETLSIFPNPAYILINVSNLPPESDQALLTNVQGVVLNRWTIDDTAVRLNIEDLAPGVYLLNILSQNQIIRTHRLIKY
jgi:subtilisin-like proprotein convertase family protein